MEDREARDNPGFEVIVDTTGVKCQEWVGKTEMRYTVSVLGTKTVLGTGHVPDMT